MKIVAIGVCGAMLAGGIYLHGPLRQSETYDRSLDEAYTTVRNMPLPQQFNRMVDNVPAGAVDKEYADRQKVVWHFMAKGKEGARFIVTFQPADDPGQVHVSTSYEELDDSALLYDGSDNLMSDPRLFGSVARTAMTEQVDARLERRAYDRKPVQQIMAGWVTKNIGAIQQEARSSMEEAAKNFEEMDRENELAKQQAEARKFSSAKPMNSGLPMTGDQR